MISAPFGSEGHRARLRPDMHAAELVMIAVDHQVDPRARPDLKAIEARRQALVGEPEHRGDEVRRAAGFVRLRRAIEPWKERSEEHTSELQSLMRISYAVFCLKKKTLKTNPTINISTDHKTAHMNP